MPSVAWDASPLDPAALEHVRQTMGTQARFEELLREFLTSSAALLAQLEPAARPSPNNVERVVHTLKSMGRLLGAAALAEACRVAEFAAHGPRAPPVAHRLLAQVRLETLRAQEAVQRLLA